jgi:putative PIN family toxin of toxin-antitoxin system
MQIVLDTNVVVSGMLSEESTPGAILSLVLEGEIQLCIDDRVLAEYDRVLRRPKFPFTPAKIESLLAYIKLTAISVNATVWPYELPDPDDRPFIEVASASALITWSLAMPGIIPPTDAEKSAWSVRRSF